MIEAQAQEKDCLVAEERVYLLSAKELQTDCIQVVSINSRA
jgi:hypothetical protein